MQGNSPFEISRLFVWQPTNDLAPKEGKFFHIDDTNCYHLSGVDPEKKLFLVTMTDAFWRGYHHKYLSQMHRKSLIRKRIDFELGCWGQMNGEHLEKAMRY